MRSVGPAFKFRMKLNSDIEIMLRKLYCFYDMPVRRCPADGKASCFQRVPICIVEFIAVSVTLPDQLRPVTLPQLCPGPYAAGIAAQTHSPPFAIVLF